MIRKITNGTAILFLLVVITFGGCKTSESIQPTTNGTTTLASIPTLTTYLAKTLAVSEDEISYNQVSHEFNIRQGIIMKENDVQAHYSVANEYKVRNGITAKAYAK